ncbi:cell envelope integrity protein CreD [Sphingobacterium hungaricum]
MENRPQTFLESVTNSVFLKLAIMLILTLLLLIPMNLVNDLIRERNARNKEVSKEITSKWGGNQVISSPVIAIPYKVFVNRQLPNDKNEYYTVVEEDKEWIFLLPDHVQIKSHVNPDMRKRGIYESVVYTSDIKLTGDFPEIDLSKLKIKHDNIDWGNAKMVFGITDLKGLSESPEVQYGTDSFVMNTNLSELNLFESNLITDLALTDASSTKKSFSIDLKIRGSQSLNFFPLANQTTIQVDGKWNHPSFNGGYLPDERLVEKDTFSGTWNIPVFSRKFSQQWNGSASRLYDTFVDSDQNLTDFPEPKTTTSSSVSSSDFVSIDFLPDVDNYQKTTRVAKYGILIILLTFVSLLFTELLKKQRIHLIQYVLIGAAMVLFYSLLLSISEHLGFNWAYAMAAVATVILIASFIGSITKNSKTALVFAGILSGFYGFIYMLLQLRDFSLIVGTIGVFIILAVLMRLSTKVNWYQFEQK